MIHTQKLGNLTSKFWSKILFYLPSKQQALEVKAARGYLRSLGVKKPGSIFTFTSPSELATLMRWAMLCPPGAIGLEIGSHLGASAIFIAGALSKHGGKLYCVDTWENQTMPDGRKDTWQAFSDNTKSLAEWIVPLRGFSTQIPLDSIPGKIRFAFIDGDHSYEAVRADFHYYEPLYADDVVIAFHDSTGYEGVARFTGDLFSSGKWVILDHRHSLLIIHRSNWRK